MTTGGYVITANGAVLPNRSRTPGAINPAVTQTSIHTTICVPGWTSTVRPSSEYTTTLKQQQLTTGYAYKGNTDPSAYEEDHLIPLELGGSPTSTLNLWPEPSNVTNGSHTKDRVENQLNEMVCNGTMALAKAQQAIAANWFTAYQLYVSTAPAPARPKPPATSTAPPAPAPAPATSAAHGCTTTSSGNCIRAGQFCPRADYGQQGHDANGSVLTCTGDSEHPRWEH